MRSPPTLNIAMLIMISAIFGASVCFAFCFLASPPSVEKILQDPRRFDLSDYHTKESLFLTISALFPIDSANTQVEVFFHDAGLSKSEQRGSESHYTWVYREPEAKDVLKRYNAVSFRFSAATNRLEKISVLEWDQKGGNFWPRPRAVRVRVVDDNDKTQQIGGDK